MENILEVNQIKKYYKIKTGLLQKTQYVKAVDDVSFSIKKGQTFGLVGESGCGKSTLGKVIIRLEDATSGSIIVNGEDITRLQGKKLRKSRQQYQMIFQDPYASLNPMQMVGDIISEPILNYKKLPKEEIKKEVLYLLKCVGLSEDAYYKYAHEFSGGQRQRVGIARALALRPSLIVADEPVSALDVSVQSQVLNLLKDLQEQFKLSYLFIAHDLSVVIVQATLLFAGMIVVESGLSFLGFGISKAIPSWGNMLSDAQEGDVISGKPWIWMPPAIMITLTILSINFVGEGLKDAFNPRGRR